MAVNGETLRKAWPIRPMLDEKVYAHGVSHGLSEAGYDIRIKQGIHFTRGWFGQRCIEVFDFDSFGRAHEPTTKRGRFVIASSVEEFSMPADLAGIVHDKSTWARRGLSVFNTVIEPGWKGHLTYELVYHGDEDLFIPAGSGIAQVVFSRVSDPMTYAGRYQNQEDRPVEAIAS